MDMPEKPTHNLIPYIVAGVAAALVVFTGWYVITVVNAPRHIATAPMPPTPTLGPTSAPSPTTPPLKRYRNSDVGVNFEYPSTWSVSTSRYPDRQLIVASSPKNAVGQRVCVTYDVDKSCGTMEGCVKGQMHEPNNRDMRTSQGYSIDESATGPGNRYPRMELYDRFNKMLTPRSIGLVAYTGFYCDVNLDIANPDVEFPMSTDQQRSDIFFKQATEILRSTFLN